MKPINSDALSTSQLNYDIPRPDQSIDLVVLNDAFKANSNDSVNISFKDLYKSLSITSKEIVDKINELLKSKLPDGVQSLKPSEVTPESTSDTIVQGVTSLFAAFTRQNPKLTPENLVKTFIEQAKSGVEQGYGQAKQILGDLGAFEYEGVESGIATTKDLIMQKLDTFAKQKLEELTGTRVSNSSAQAPQEEVLQQAGAKVINTKV